LQYINKFCNTFWSSHVNNLPYTYITSLLFYCVMTHVGMSWGFSLFHIHILPYFPWYKGHIENDVSNNSSIFFLTYMLYLQSTSIITEY
jgi:hypothetical protein